MNSKQNLRNYIIEILKGQYIPGIAGEMIKNHLDFVYIFFSSILHSMQAIIEQKKEVPEGFKKELKDLVLTNIDINNDFSEESLRSGLNRLQIKYGDSSIEEAISWSKVKTGISIAVGAITVAGFLIKIISDLKKKKKVEEESRNFIRTNAETYEMYLETIQPLIIKILDDLLNLKIKTDNQLKYRFYGDINKITNRYPSLKTSLQTWGSRL